MGFFGKLFGEGAGPPPDRPGHSSGGMFGEDYGKPLTDTDVQGGPFPKVMRLRAGMSDYDLYGSWQVVSLNSPADYAAVRDQVVHGYYKQFGMYRLPDGSETIRWNETTWRAVRERLHILYDPKFEPSGGAGR